MCQASLLQSSRLSALTVTPVTCIQVAPLGKRTSHIFSHLLTSSHIWHLLTSSRISHLSTSDIFSHLTSSHISHLLTSSHIWRLDAPFVWLSSWIRTESLALVRSRMWTTFRLIRLFPCTRETKKKEMRIYTSASGAGMQLTPRTWTLPLAMLYSASTLPTWSSCAFNLALCPLYLLGFIPNQ